MASYKIAIERVSEVEETFYKEQSSIFCDKKYATFKKKIDKEIFNSEIADVLFEDIWLKNNYDLIVSQKIANKLFEISSSLSSAIAKNIAQEVIRILDCSNNKENNVVSKINYLCEKGLEKNIMCLLRNEQKKYYIKMISPRPEESNYLAFLLSKTYS